VGKIIKIVNKNDRRQRIPVSSAELAEALEEVELDDTLEED
jgi:hypothetical protein